MSKNQNNTRADRQHGHRARYEANRKRLLAMRPEVCALCGKPIDYELKWPHPLSATVDHIIPVTRGGHPFDIDNLQVVHANCNRQKGNKLSQEMFKEQQESASRLIPNDDLPLTFDWLHPETIQDGE